MATVSEPRGKFNAAETDRRVRHPLAALRGHIRRYVLLEGLAVAILYLAVCFWAGLAMDYGLFRLFAFDLILRVIMLCLFLGGLLALVVWKVLFRITREFSDSAVALVLEKRFPREL